MLEPDVAARRGPARIGRDRRGRRARCSAARAEGFGGDAPGRRGSGRRARRSRCRSARATSVGMRRSPMSRSPTRWSRSATRGSTCSPTQSASSTSTPRTDSRSTAAWSPRIDLENGARGARRRHRARGRHRRDHRSDAGTGHDGPVAFNRSPRVDPRFPGDKLIAPKLPSEQDRQPFPWLVLAAPLIIGPVMFIDHPAARRRSSSSRCRRCSSPATSSPSARPASARRSSTPRSSTSDSTTCRDAARERARDRARRAALGDAVDARRCSTPRCSLGPTAVDAAARALAVPHRQPRHRHAAVPQHGDDQRRGGGAARASSTRSRALHAAVRGDRRRARRREPALRGCPRRRRADRGSRGLRRARLVVQATGLHSPSELVVAAIVSPGWTPEFEWLKWLPHTASAHSPDRRSPPGEQRRDRRSSALRARGAHREPQAQARRAWRGVDEEVRHRRGRICRRGWRGHLAAAHAGAGHPRAHLR